MLIFVFLLLLTSCHALNLKLHHAMMLTKAAEDFSSKAGLKVCIAVCDAGGHLLAIHRQDGCFPLAVKIAQAKAVGSALFNKNGKDIAEMYETRPAFFNQIDKLDSSLPLIPGLGGLAIRNKHGEAIGGTGHSYTRR